MSFDGFFAEWSDNNKTLISLVVSEAILMFLILAWVVVNIPTEAGKASIFLWLLLGSALVAGLDTISERNKYFAYVDYGNSIPMYLFALILGGLIAIIMTSNQAYSLLTPFTTVAGTGIIGFLYVVIAAPFVEEKFFRGFLNPNAGLLFSNFGFPFPLTLGVLFSCVCFGLFHYIAYGGIFTAMLGAILFGLIASIGNYALKTRSFGLGLHIVTNFVIIGGFSVLIGAI